MEREASRVFSLLSGQASTVQSLLRRAQLLSEIQVALREHLHEPWSSHIHVANIRDGRLIIFADNASTLTPLRFSSGAIVSFVRDRFGLDIQTMDARIKPRSP